jgi:isoquinoline 1-oxidoreductase alpha subunit
MAATALLRQAPHATEAEIEASMVNLCRCGTYNAIRAAMQDLAGSAQATADPVAQGLGTVVVAGGVAAIAAAIADRRAPVSDTTDAA